MPDWSYHVLFKPALFRMPPQRARDLTLSVIGGLASLPGGLAMIDFLGHMRAPAELAMHVLGSVVSSPVGLGAGLTNRADALKAMSRFGFGFIELGPIAIRTCRGSDKITRDAQSRTIHYRGMPECQDADRFLRSAERLQVPVLLGARIVHFSSTSPQQAVDECSRLMEKIAGVVQYFTLDPTWLLDSWTADDLRNYLRGACASAAAVRRSVLLCVPPDVVASRFQIIHCAVLEQGLTGIVIAGGTQGSDDTRLVGATTRQASIQAVQFVKDLAPNLVVIGSGGIMQPADALSLLAAGADLVQLHSGLIFSGPGLPKRTNEAILWSQLPDGASAGDSSLSCRDLRKQGWMGFALVGAGLIVTALAAMVIGLMWVVLPYDERFVGLSRSSMAAINPNLLHFMCHDRVIFASTTLSTGIMFLMLSWFGIRSGHHWAYVAMRASAAVGFGSFLLFLGFHYLDPFHAAVNLSLLPFFIWGLLCPPTFVGERSKNLFNDKCWMNSLVGQFWFVCIGSGLMLAGATICRVGVSTVFVPEDLQFMDTTTRHLASQSPNLIPLIAHDRAGFGGALVTVGIAVLITALQGFRQGEKWVWWMLLLSGLPGFAAVFAIHYSIGYNNWWHLAPAYVAAAMFVAGLTLSYSFLCDRSSAADAHAFEVS